MLQEYPLVSIITINFNKIELTLALLNSLESITYPNIEIIVVDNGSELNPKAVIEGKYPNVKIIVSTINLGFAGANNLGIKMAQGKYLLFINNDTEVDTDFLQPLVKKIDRKSTRLNSSHVKISYAV